MRIVVVGAGKLGYSIAERLSQEEYDVIVVDNNASRLQNVQASLDQQAAALLPMLHPMHQVRHSLS